MAVRWDFFVNSLDSGRFTGLEGRENRNLAYVREFAAVVSILQVKTFSMPRVSGLLLSKRAWLLYLGQNQLVD